MSIFGSYSMSITNSLTREIEKMEDEVTPVATRTEEDAKLRRIHLKDELYRLLTAT